MKEYNKGRRETYKSDRIKAVIWNNFKGKDCMYSVSGKKEGYYYKGEGEMYIKLQHYKDKQLNVYP